MKSRNSISVFLFLLVVLGGGWSQSIQAQLSPEVANSLVFIESLDADGQRISIGTGLVVKKGFVATNYHYIAGGARTRVWLYGKSETWDSDGYLAVEEEEDLILLSVPNIDAPPTPFSGEAFPGDGVMVSFLEDPTSTKLKVSQGKIKGVKNIKGVDLHQIISPGSEGSTGGPVIHNNQIIGFNVAGYNDGKYYAFAIPVARLGPLLRRSFIIKSFNSLQDSLPMDHSHAQSALIQSLSSVLWISFEDAVKLARKDKRKILVDVYTHWCGWCKIMEKNTYSRKKLIRYINENYYAVRFDAETSDTIQYAGKSFTYVPELHAHQLAYSLLGGNLNFPSTVFLDEDIKLLTSIQGYQDEHKMNVILHYFNENAYLEAKKTFQDYENAFRTRKDEE